MKSNINGIPTNAVEWMKANALSATPADPTEYSLRDVIVVKAVKIKKIFKHVAKVNTDGTITHLDECEIEQEMFDGQFMWLKNVPSGQLRGWCFKAMGLNGEMLISLVNGWEDMMITDIDGNKRRLGDAVGFCTDSCWKGSKFFDSYAEFCDKAEELAQFIPGMDKIWIVREAGEIDDEEADYGRRLSRQATQQWVNASLAQLSNLTRSTRNALNKMKTYDGLVKLASEKSKPVQDRTDLAGLIEAMPELVTSAPMQDWAKSKYVRKQLNAAANRIHVNGNYPYICMDPLAMIQVHILGINPDSQDLGFLKAGEVCNFKYHDGQKLFAIRYPANYQTGTVLVNRIIDAFRGLGDVAVLPYYGDTIIREDGDFDGDEMMFCPDDIVIRLTEQMIDTFCPELIDFPHGKKAEMVPWETRDNRFDQISDALWRSMKFNLVGVYSNMSVRCMHLGKIEECIMMHVMAILCLDMVKGTEISPAILKAAEDIRSKVSKMCDGAMPWNQQFRDALIGVSDRKYMEPSNDTVDTITRLVMSTGEYTFDAQGHEVGDSWKLMTNGGSRITRKGVLDKALSDEFCQFFSRDNMSEEDLAIYRNLKEGKEIGVADLMREAAINESAMMYTCPGDTLDDKKCAYRELVREAAFKLGRTSGMPDDELKNSVINWAAKIAVTGEGMSNADYRGKYAMFVMRVFALDFIRNIEANRGVAPEDTFEARRNASTDDVMSITEDDLSID